MAEPSVPPAAPPAAPPSEPPASAEPSAVVAAPKTEVAAPTLTAAPTSEAASKRHRRIFLAVSGVLVTAVIVASADVLFPFLLALIVAFIFTPAVLWVERRRVPRFVAILLCYLVALGGIAGFFAVIIPSMVTEVKAIQRDLPSRIKYIEQHWLPEIDRKLNQWSGNAAKASAAPDSADSAAIAEAPPADSNGSLVAMPAPSTSVAMTDDEKSPPPILIEKREDGSYAVRISDQIQLRRVGDEVWRLEPEEKHEQVSTAKLASKALARATKYLQENAGEVFKFGQAVVGAVWRGVFTLFMTLMLAGYIMLTHEKILAFFRSLCAEESRPSFDRFLRRLERGLAGVVRGQLIICVMNGILAAIGFWIFGLKYWPIMAIMAAVGSIIPIFGSILSAIPAVAIGLTQSVGTAVAVLAWIIGIHQIEANFLNPKIIGDQAKIHPVLVVFSLIVGEHFFQITGALLAVPVMSVVQTIFLHFRESYLGIESPLATKIPELVAKTPK
jgi:predicted PurR-regulated permease PerM